MGITRLLQSFPLKKQMVVKSLVLVTLLFIVYQLTFVAELSESAKPKTLRQSAPAKPHKKGIGRERLHPRDLVVNEDSAKDVQNDSVLDNKIIKLNENRKRHGEHEKNKDKYIVLKKPVNKQIENEHHANKKPEGSKGKEIKPDILKEPEIKAEGHKDTLTFICRKSKKSISIDKVNDDYCDCPEDGSDEPRTNACTNSKFTCTKAVNGFPKTIPSGWVNDGVCDCCDGSDEWQKKVAETLVPMELQKKVGRFMSPCPNQCP